MKQLIIGLCMAIMVGCSFVACEADRPTYDGPDYVKFSDTLSTIAIQNEDYHDVMIATTRACDYDRVYGIEIIEKESNAIEGLHYSVESNSVTIKAGEQAAAFRIRGHFDNIDDTDSIGVTLRLVNQESIWSSGEKAHVVLQKVCPFTLDTFLGYCRVTSQYFSDYMQATSERIVRAEKVEGEENTVVLKNFFYEGYDLKLHFNTKEPLEPILEVEDGQIIATTAQAFNTIYGDGYLRVEQPVSYTSFFNVCQNYSILYSTMYVEEVGVVGTYMTILEWISDAEAEAGY